MGELTTLVLVRHGETDWNVEGRYQGQADPPLNERGRRQARRVGRELGRLGLDAIYSSDLSRAYDTALEVAKAACLDVRVDARLREIHQGEWQGLLVAEIERRYPEAFRRWRVDPTSVTPPGGEDLFQLEVRVLASAHELVNSHPGQRVAIISHKLPISVIKCHYQGIPLREIWKLIPANATREELRARPSRIEI